MRNDNGIHIVLIAEHIIELLQVCNPFVFLFYLFGFIIEVEWVSA